MTHTITTERITPQLRVAYSIPSGYQVAVIERFDGSVVKVCHTDTGHDLQAVASVALAYARSSGATYVAPEGLYVCDYGTGLAARVDLSDTPLCDGHARGHYGHDWQLETRKLGIRAAARIAAHYATN